MRIRLYIVTDAPWAGTGFGEEMKNIAFRLAQSGEYEVIWQSLQHLGYPIDVPDTMFPDIPHKESTIKMIGTGGGLPNEFGSYIFERHYGIYVPDLVLFMGDPYCIKTWIPLKKKLKFPFVMYVTLDGLPIHPRWAEYLHYVNLVIAMTEWAQIEYMKIGLSLAYVHHGVDWNWWSSNEDLKAKLKRKYGIDEETVVYINRDMNQHRKRHDILLKCWKALRPESKNIKLILWMPWHSRMGWDLEYKIKQYDVPRETILSPRDLVGYPKVMECPNSPVLQREIARLGDIYTSTSSGEGFGKNNLEAMSLGQPVIATRFSAITEIVGKGGILVPPYDGVAGDYVVPDSNRSVDGAVVNAERFTEAMLYLYQNEKERRELGLLAREQARDFDYDTHIIPAWHKLLSQINPDDIMMREALQV